MGCPEQNPATLLWLLSFYSTHPSLSRMTHSCALKNRTIKPNVVSVFLPLEFTWAVSSHLFLMTIYCVYTLSFLCAPQLTLLTYFHFSPSQHLLALHAVMASVWPNSGSMTSGVYSFSDFYYVLHNLPNDLCPSFAQLFLPFHWLLRFWYPWFKQ